MHDLKQHIRSVRDFPKPGIMFRDITPLLSTPSVFQQVVDQFAERYQGQGISAVCAAEARGFIFAAPLAMKLKAGFVPIRKPGKLPFKTQSHSYSLEYGNDTLEMHVDAVRPGERILIVDDLLATGGTVDACVKLAQKSGAEIAGCAFLIELTFLNGREKLAPVDCFSLIQYADET